MDAALNPYSPGSGRRPRALVGRDAELTAFDVVLARAAAGLGDRSIALSGLRGVGKTVLLNTFRDRADRAGWFTVKVEARNDGGAATRAKLGRELLVANRRMNKPSLPARLRAALPTVTSFSATLGVSGASLGLEGAPGRADSGNPEIDLEEVVADLSPALREAGVGFAIFIDEMQDVDEELLAALLTAQHTADQEDWPFFVVGAGLPNLASVLSESRSYAERLFTYRAIGTLDEVAARAALTEPAQPLGVRYEAEAAQHLVDAAGRYPYFLQEFGRAVWEVAPTSTLDLDDARAAVSVGVAQLDQGFFPSRWDRATAAERRYLRAMSADQGEGSSTGAVAERLGKKITSLGPVRAALISKGLVYAPEHGRIAFTVPMMADYITRQHDED